RPSAISPTACDRTPMPSLLFYYQGARDSRDLHSFPTRRSSDLRAFELFAQAERTSDRAQGGLGLGLALVKRLCELHGGSVTVHRSEEYTSVLQSRGHLVCRLLLEKKNDP